MRTRLLAILAALLVSACATPAHDTARLKSELLMGESATQVLTRWCTNLRLASPAVIRAERDGLAKDADAETRNLLDVRPDDVLRYRRVKLVCGTHVLSEADNWYVPARLTSAMNATLDTTDTPFGTVVKPLKFHRKTLDAIVAPEPQVSLRIRAILLTPEEKPFSLVVENYKPALTRNQ